LFNLPPGNWGRPAEKGPLPRLPERFDDLKQSLETGASLREGDRPSSGLHLMGRHRPIAANRKPSSSFYKSVDVGAAEFFAAHGPSTS